VIPLRGILEAELGVAYLWGPVPRACHLGSTIAPLAFVNRLNLLRAERP